VDWLVEANVLEMAAISKTLASTNQSTRRPKPKEHQNYHRLENLENHMFQFLP
jgi:hypothetical protein